MRYWPSVRSRRLDMGQVLLLRSFLRSIKNARKEWCQYPAILTEHVWSIKDLLYDQKIKPKNFAFAGTKRAIPSGQDKPISTKFYLAQQYSDLFTLIPQRTSKRDRMDSNYKHAQPHAWGPYAVTISSMREHAQRVQSSWWTCAEMSKKK